MAVRYNVHLKIPGLVSLQYGVVVNLAVGGGIRPATAPPVLVSFVIVVFRSER